jgi:hypothetical protein
LILLNLDLISVVLPPAGFRLLVAGGDVGGVSAMADQHASDAREIDVVIFSISS